MSSLVSLAAAAFSDLRPAEIALVQAVEDGHEAVPPEAGGTEVRSGVVEWLCSDAGARPRVHRHGLALRAFTITGLVDLIHADVTFPVQFRDCVFLGELWLKSARLKSLAFRGCRLCGMNADSCTVDTNVLMVDGFENTGEVALRGAVIGGDLRTDGGTFSNVQGCALVCDRSQIRGGVFLSGDAAVSKYLGEVRFSGADVGGNLACDRGIFRNPGGVAIVLERIKTGGSVFLRGCATEGQVNLAASDIGVALDCRGATIKGSGERTLFAEKARVGSHILLDGQFTCDSVHLLLAAVGGGLRCCVAKIGKLDLRHARVDGPFEWAEMASPATATVDLRDASLVSIKDDEASWPAIGHLHLDGLRFERFSDSVIDVGARLRWLNLDSSFSAQPYWQLASVYERGGRPDCAREVLYVYERLARSRSGGKMAAAWSLLLRWTIGYGYKLWRAGLLMGVLTLIGIGMAFAGYYTKLLAPSDKEARAQFVATGSVPVQYPRFSATIYSIEHSLPGVTLGLGEAWSADTAGAWSRHRWAGPIVRFWFWLQSLLGWLLSIFFVAGLLGAVRARK